MRLSLYLVVLLATMPSFTGAAQESGPRVRISAIVVPTRTEAQELFERLNAGEDFATLGGGDLGYFGPGELITELNVVALELQVGQHSDIIETGQGFFIIKKTDELAATNDGDSVWLAALVVAFVALALVVWGVRAMRTGADAHARWTAVADVVEVVPMTASAPALHGDDPEKTWEAHYHQKSDDELRAIASDNPPGEPHARDALAKELRRRAAKAQAASEAVKIVGLEGLTVDEVNLELERGARFVVFDYCISVIVMTFRRPSSVYFIRAGESALARGLGFAAISTLLGWWGIPWGPIRTVPSIIVNLSGGRDVTAETIASLNQAALDE